MGTAIKSKLAAENQKLNFEEAEKTEKFKYLSREKKKFIVPLTIFFLVFYFALPILTSYTNVLNHPAIGDISWVWVFAVAQFLMTWSLVMIYMKKAATFDRIAEEIMKEEIVRGGTNA